jgi:hypothetical protein
MASAAPAVRAERAAAMASDLGWRLMIGPSRSNLAPRAPAQHSARPFCSWGDASRSDQHPRRDQAGDQHLVFVGAQAAVVAGAVLPAREPQDVGLGRPVGDEPAGGGQAAGATSLRLPLVRASGVVLRHRGGVARILRLLAGVDGSGLSAGVERRAGRGGGCARRVRRRGASAALVGLPRPGRPAHGRACRSAGVARIRRRSR